MRTSRQAYRIREEDDFIELGKCKLVSDETYFGDTNYVTASMLKALATDTKLYEHRYVKGHQMKETPAMELGSAVHAMLAGMEDMVVAYDGVRRGKDYLAWVQDQPEGALIVPKKVHEIAFNCMLAMAAVPPFTVSGVDELSPDKVTSPALSMVSAGEAFVVNAIELSMLLYLMLPMSMSLTSPI